MLNHLLIFTADYCVHALLDFSEVVSKIADHLARLKAHLNI
jgi:hypothetical protein